MDDRFLTSLRRDPEPAFAARLRARVGEARRPRRALQWKPAFATVVVAGVVGALFAFPSVRVSAQSMLDLFRVRNFAAVKFDPSRMEKLEALSQDRGLLILGKPEVLQDPGQSREVASPQAAEAIAGIDVRVPSDLQPGLVLRKVSVEGAGAMRVTPNVAQIRTVLDALDIDLEVPSNLDGRAITVRKPPMVKQEYASERGRRALFLQARSPEVDLPAGTDLSRLAEIGMRVLGVDATQARRLSQSVDWNTTLLVPVPQNASKFRGVEIQGHPGLLITSTKEASGGREGTMVLWSEGERVFAIMGDLSEVPLMRMAESVR